MERTTKRCPVALTFVLRIDWHPSLGPADRQDPLVSVIGEANGVEARLERIERSHEHAPVKPVRIQIHRLGPLECLRRESGRVLSGRERPRGATEGKRHEDGDRDTVAQRGSHSTLILANLPPHLSKRVRQVATMAHPAAIVRPGRVAQNLIQTMTGGEDITAPRRNGLDLDSRVDGGVAGRPNAAFDSLRYGLGGDELPGSVPVRIGRREIHLVWLAGRLVRVEPVDEVSNKSVGEEFRDDLRHTAASRIVMAGGSLLDAGEHLGDSTAEMRKR